MCDGDATCVMHGRFQHFSSWVDGASTTAVTRGSASPCSRGRALRFSLGVWARLQYCTVWQRPFGVGVGRRINHPMAADDIRDLIDSCIEPCTVRIYIHSATVLYCYAYGFGHRRHQHHHSAKLTDRNYLLRSFTPNLISEHRSTCTDHCPAWLYIYTEAW